MFLCFFPPVAEVLKILLVYLRSSRVYVLYLILGCHASYYQLVYDFLFYDKVEFLLCFCLCFVCICISLFWKKYKFLSPYLV